MDASEVGASHDKAKKLTQELQEIAPVASIDGAVLPLCLSSEIAEIDLLRAAIKGQREIWAALDSEDLYRASGGFHLPRSYSVDDAVAFYLYTLSNPRVYMVVNHAMFNAHPRNLGTARGGISEGACLPYIKFLQTALDRLPSPYVVTRGQVRRTRLADVASIISDMTGTGTNKKLKMPCAVKPKRMNAG